MSPAHKGLTLTWEHEDCAGGGLELGEPPLSLPSSESSGIRWWSGPLNGVLLPVPAFMRRSVKEITKHRRQFKTFKKTAGNADAKGPNLMIDGMRYELWVTDTDEDAQIECTRQTHTCLQLYLPFLSAESESSSDSWDFGAKTRGLRVELCRSGGR